MWCYIFLCLVLTVSDLTGIKYDSFSGKPLTKSQERDYELKNNTEYCTNDVKPCDPEEWRRIDGTCYNLNSPQRGAIHTPQYNVLPPIFSNNNEPVNAKSGKPKPYPRYLRTEILRVGKGTEMSITQLLSHFLAFSVGDFGSIHDVLRTMRTNCCGSQQLQEDFCIPSQIPKNDPVLRYTGLNCMNLTKPESFQTHGCLPSSTPFVRIQFATPTLDMNSIYNYYPNSIQNMRAYSGGLLKTEIDNGKIWPQQDPNLKDNMCSGNEYPKETRCHLYLPNGSVGANILHLVFYRYHNLIATKLAKVNPCWDDEQLFYTARDINIALYSNIYFYEMLPILLGEENLVRDGILSTDVFRDLYDDHELPVVSTEFSYMMRWFHLILDSTLNFYDKDGHLTKTYSLVDYSSRTGFLVLDDNLEQLYQGSFRQKNGKFDDTVDPDIVDRIFGVQHFSGDVITSDLIKGRYFGIQSYVKYREFCSNRSYTTFEDLSDVMTDERIDRLRTLYEDVEDIDLIAGVWAESYIEGARVPYTVYCLVTEQLKRTIASDRHWYERPNRPHAFSLEQLKSVKAVKMSRLLCDVADGVTKIQPKAFRAISSENPLVDCSSSDIAKLDFNLWKDAKCANVSNQ